jgi:hypothetical protein
LSRQPVYEALSYTWGNPFDDDYAAESWKAYQDLSDTCAIELDGVPFEVTISLSHALEKLRKHDQDVLVWVDAICIDQAHNTEKTWQIKKMRDIYQNALRVIVWLGPADRTSDIAMEILEGAYRYKKRVENLPRVGPFESRVAVPHATGREYADQEIAASLGKLFGLEVKSNTEILEFPTFAMDEFFHRAYWGRGWCWQEFAVATKVRIVCGNKILEDGDMALQNFLATWDSLRMETEGQPESLDHRPWAMMECRRAVQNMRYLEEKGFKDDSSINVPNTPSLHPIWLNLNVGPSSLMSKSSVRLTQFQPDLTVVGQAYAYREAVQNLSLKRLLEDSSVASLQVTPIHKEDRIYALIGIASDAAELGITEQYGTAWETVYTQLAVSYVAKSDLWFLNWCQASSPNHSPDLPSWVPDWSWGYQGSMVGQHYHPSAAHLGTVQPPQEPRVSFSSEHPQLMLKGMIVDHISWVSASRDGYHHDQAIDEPRLTVFWWIRDLVSHCIQYTRRDLWTVLLGGSQRLPVPPQIRADVTQEELKQRLDAIFDILVELDKDQSLEHESAIYDTFIRCFLQATRRKCVFQTRDGRLGLAQVGIQSGDQVGILAGIETAFVLRPVEASSVADQRYHLKCEAFVLNLMDDEGLKSRACSLTQDLILE